MARLLRTRVQLDVFVALDELIDELIYSQILERLGWSQKSKGSLSRVMAELRELGVVEGSGRSLRIVH